jgi:REP element-mobilizing transposase RayT
MHDREWDDNDRPLAYFITFRTHGTWLHGDQRGSVERHGRNVYGTPRVGLDPVFSVKMDRNMVSKPFILNGRERAIVESAIRSVCDFRIYALFAINVRANHAHSVVSAAAGPNVVMNAFKANATRELRAAGLVDSGGKVWSRGGSTRYLWKPDSVERAVHYTLYGQDEDLPDF